LEAAIERALAALDEIDGDADLEPWLAKFNSGAGQRLDGLDLEEEHDGREPPEDDELPLGWSEGAGWEHGSRSLPGSLGYNADYLEPSLGSLGVIDQRRWAEGGHGLVFDGEEQCEDEGGACEDEGAITGDAEPDAGELCNWQDEGDQSVLRPLPVTPGQQPTTARSPHQNVGGYIAVRVLSPGEPGPRE
jgi:hypothetical protein